MPRLGPERFRCLNAFEIDGKKGPFSDSDLITFRFTEGEITIQILPESGSLALNTGKDQIYLTIPELLARAFSQRGISVRKVLEVQSVAEQNETTNWPDDLKRAVLSMLGDEDI